MRFTSRSSCGIARAIVERRLQGETYKQIAKDLDMTE
jgi:hypothetical protein